VHVTLRFLHLVNRTVGWVARPRDSSPLGGEVSPQSGDGGVLEPAQSIEIGGQTYVSWQEAMERTLVLGEVQPGGRRRVPVELAAGREFEPLPGQGVAVAGIERTWEAIQGHVEVDCERLGGEIARISVRVANHTPLEQAPGASREQAAPHAMVSTHVILRVQNGQFVSATDPPDQLRELASGCQNTGCWPVLVGGPPDRQTMLASPIILEDYPRVASQSPGDFFDATEIDELLSLRILTLTDEEKEEMRGADEKARLLLERTEALGAEELLRLHGTAHVGWPEGEEG
jgi:hypothetical protein